MKVYVTTDNATHIVNITHKEPTHWSPTHKKYVAVAIPCRGPEDVGVGVCRAVMRQLLRGTGKRLPKHGSKEIVTINLTAE